MSMRVEVKNAVRCRKCGADAGDVCRTSSGATAAILHVVRKQDAKGIVEKYLEQMRVANASGYDIMPMVTNQDVRDVLDAREQAS